MLISVSLLVNAYSINAQVYTDSDLEQFKSSGDSNDYKQTEKGLDYDDKQYSPGDTKIKHNKTKIKYTARGCEVEKFSQYNLPKHLSFQLCPYYLNQQNHFF